jgi:outer membrane protein TolC
MFERTRRYMSTSSRRIFTLVVALLVVQVPAARAQSGLAVPARQSGPPVGSQSPPGIVPTPLLSSVASAAPGTVGTTLSLADAIARGLEYNLGVVVARERAQAATGTKWITLSGLLPTVSAHVLQSRQEINLEAYGFPVAPGQSPIIGPFNVSDRRIGLTQTIFDYSAIETARAGAAAEQAAAFAYQDARGAVVQVVATLYLQALAANARIDASRAQYRTAEALYSRAGDMKKAGMVSGVEVLRAQVQMQSQEQHVIAFENEFAKAKLSLARAIGQPLGQPFALADSVPYQPLDAMSADEALAEALQSRSDYKAGAELVKMAEASRRAVKGLWLPSVQFSADYGRIGQSWGSALTTYSAGANVRVPLFQGGRVKGRLLQADAQVAGERAQLADLKARIEYEVRAALLDVTSADDRVRVARSAADLANQQLAQTEDRFAAGVANQLEVVQAQEAVATASENLIASLFAHNVAKVALARALGIAERAAGHILGGPTS